MEKLLGRISALACKTLVIRASRLRSISWVCLTSPGNLLKRGFSTIHSVKDYDDLNGAKVRSYFREQRGRCTAWIDQRAVS
jgi:hypothetical protein